MVKYRIRQRSPINRKRVLNLLLQKALRVMPKWLRNIIPGDTSELLYFLVDISAITAVDSLRTSDITGIPL